MCEKCSMPRRKYPEDSINEVAGGLIIAVIVCFALYVLIGLLIWGSNAAQDEPGNKVWSVDAQDYMSQYGLDLSQPQPLTVGSTITGTEGHAEISGSTEGFLLFSYTQISGSSSEQPGSAVRLGMVHDGVSYILELPYNEIQFIVKPGAKAEATFTLDTSQVDTAPMYFAGHDLWTYENYHAVPLDPNELEQTSAWQDGPAQILQDHLVSAKLTVTPQQYAAFLGTSS